MYIRFGNECVTSYQKGTFTRWSTWYLVKSRHQGRMEVKTNNAKDSTKPWSNTAVATKPMNSLSVHIKELWYSG